MDRSTKKKPHEGRTVVAKSTLAICCILVAIGFWWRPAWILVGCGGSFLATIAIQLFVGFSAVLSPGRGKRRIILGELLASFSRLIFQGFVIWFAVVAFPPVGAATTISWALLVESQKILSGNKQWSARRICIAAAECAIASILGFAALYWVYGIQNSDGTYRDPLLSLYFSIVTWTTLGYGDFYPVPQVRLVAAIEALSAYGFMGVFLGQLVAAKSTEKFRET